MKFEDLFWLIGWLEAEGSFGNSLKDKAPWFSGECKDEDTIDRICLLLRCNKYFRKSQVVSWADTFRFRVQRLKYVQLLFNMSKFMSARRKEQINVALIKNNITQDHDWFLSKDLKKQYFIYWLAGYLEGEGSFLAGPPSDPNMSRIQLQTTDEDIALEISDYFNVKYHKVSSKDNHKTAFSIAKRGSEAVQLMRQLQPLMSTRRQKQIQKAIDSYHNKVFKPTNAKFSEFDIQAIKAMRIGGMKVRQIALYFNVAHSTISRICGNHRYIAG